MQFFFLPSSCQDEPERNGSERARRRAVDEVVVLRKNGRAHDEHGVQEKGPRVQRVVLQRAQPHDARPQRVAARHAAVQLRAAGVDLAEKVGVCALVEPREAGLVARGHDHTVFIAHKGEHAPRRRQGDELRHDAEQQAGPAENARKVQHAWRV